MLSSRCSGPMSARALLLVGLLLNCVSVMMGGGFVYLMFANMGRFT